MPFQKFPTEYKVGEWLVTQFNFMDMDIKEQMRLDRLCSRYRIYGRKKKKKKEEKKEC